MGESTGCGLQNVPVGLTFESLQQAVKYLCDYHGMPGDEVDYEILEDPCRNGNLRLVTARQCANHADAQNGGWFDPTQAELELWSKGELKLYSEEYTVEFFFR